MMATHTLLPVLATGLIIFKGLSCTGGEGPSPDGKLDGGSTADATSAPEAGEVGPPRFAVTTGALPLYHLPKNIAGAKARNDASGVVVVPYQQKLLFIDDGGDDASPDTVPFYLAAVSALFAPPVVLTEVPGAAELAGSLPARHRDLEALTAEGDFLYAMSSLPAVTEKADPAFRAFSRFRLKNDQIVHEETIEPRDALMAALATPTADPWFADWLARWKDQKAKDGGLQVEAITAMPDAGRLLVALRSPHYSPDYLQPTEADPTKKKTRVGDAMLVEIAVDQFDAAKLDASVKATVNLGGLGFRGMEHSPAADGYFITAGAVEAGFDYDFFFWSGKPGTPPVRLSTVIPEFAKLCRPESVAEVEHGGKKYLLVLSEESGAICEMPAAPYNYLLIELDERFLATVRSH